jgi:dTDP-4-dehydrorhamnose 3,5-epimerase
MIKGTVLKDLVLHKDERGALFEILRSDYPEFKGFGQTYITVCKPDWVKGWHYHLKQQDYFCVLRGKARIVLYDRRDNSPTKGEVNVFELGADKPQALVIPAEVVHGFECLSKGEAWILNVPNQLYNYSQPDEHRIPLDSKEIPYEPWWKKKGW